MISRRPNYEIVLRYLRNHEEEATVKLPCGATIGMTGGKVCQILYVYNSGRDFFDGNAADEERWVELDLSINDFIRECANLSEETIIQICTHSALMQISEESANTLKGPVDF